MLIGCLGGLCQSREKCAHYLQGTATEDIRLCGKEESPMVVKEVADDLEANRDEHTKIR